MAARDRNLFAWQAYVIAMSFVVVGLLIALGFMVASTSNTEKSKLDAVNKAQTAGEATRKLTAEMAYVKGMLGQGQFTEAEWNQMKASVTDAQAEALQAQYAKDMSLFGPNEPIQNRNYPKLAEYLLRELRARNAQVDTAAKTQMELAKKMDSTVKNEMAGREAAEKKSAQLEKDLENQRIESQKKLDAGQETITNVNKTLQDNIAKHAQEKARLEADRKAFEKTAKEVSSLNTALRERIRLLEGEDFQTAQGEITMVAEGGRIVWVNIGKADGLRPGVRFGIINSSESRLKDARPKAHFEVSKLVGDHQAQGQVLSGSLQDTVVKGDWIYSPAWQKGRKVQFALLGKLDMNGDGSDDRKAITDMIIQSGGSVVEDLAPRATKSTGPGLPGMTVDTSWIVVGEGVSVGAIDAMDAQDKVYSLRYAEMQKRAKELAVSQINLDKLLSWIQSSGGAERSIPMGNAGRASDFADKRKVPSGINPVAEIYMKQGQGGPYRPAQPLEGQAQ